MKKYLVYVLIISLVVFYSCKKENPLPENIDVRQEMRDFVVGISNYSKNIKSDFIVIPQNGQALITANGEANGVVNSEYLDAIDATGREDLFYGYTGDDEETPDEDKQLMLDLCLLFEQNNVEVLAIDYCSTQSKIDNSYQQNHTNGFISFAADERNLNNIPSYLSAPFNENTSDITDISMAKNFLYLINPENYSTKAEMLSAIAATNYDLVIIDLYFNDVALTAQDIASIKSKHNGGLRKVIAYVSIGEAEDYRPYWNQEWENDKPLWLEAENPAWRGNYKVRYWEQEWKDIVYGNEGSYMSKVLNAGFDGVYLDIIDGYEYFEAEYDLE
jgi:cysteinyl-tRNA synthetase